VEGIGPTEAANSLAQTRASPKFDVLGHSIGGSTAQTLASVIQTLVQKPIPARHRSRAGAASRRQIRGPRRMARFNSPKTGRRVRSRRFLPLSILQSFLDKSRPQAKGFGSAPYSEGQNGRSARQRARRQWRPNDQGDHCLETKVSGGNGTRELDKNRASRRGCVMENHDIHGSRRPIHTLFRREFLRLKLIILFPISGQGALFQCSQELFVGSRQPLGRCLRRATLYPTPKKVRLAPIYYPNLLITSFRFLPQKAFAILRSHLCLSAS